jgi:hypothetical protein
MIAAQSASLGPLQPPKSSSNDINDAAAVPVTTAFSGRHPVAISNKRRCHDGSIRIPCSGGQQQRGVPRNH